MMTTPKETTTFYTRLHDAGDGSGDQILVFPDELEKQLGWRDWDVVSVTAGESGEIWIKKKEKAKISTAFLAVGVAVGAACAWLLYKRRKGRSAEAERRSLIDVLASMPKVGEDSDFEFPQDGAG